MKIIYYSRINKCYNKCEGKNGSETFKEESNNLYETRYRKSYINLKDTIINKMRQEVILHLDLRESKRCN